jgi:hypothetical protein
MGGEYQVIHYHGTPIGGGRVDAARFLAGRHAFISAAYPQDLPVAAEVCQSFALDNGAFTAWKAGGVIDVPAFVAWVEEWCLHPAFDWAIIPDVIDGTSADNDAEIESWIGTAVADYGVPVWHLHEPVERLSSLACTWDRVALGSSGDFATVGSLAWWARMGEAMRAVCDEQGRPTAKLHGLRMLDPAVFSRLPLASADSTNAGRNCLASGRWGSYMPPTAAQRADVIASRIEAHQSAAVWTEGNKQSEFRLEVYDGAL